MDLEAAQQAIGAQRVRVATLVCLAVAFGLLAGSLVMPLIGGAGDHALSSQDVSGHSRPMLSR